MPAIKEAVKLSAKLYECQQTANNFFGTEYPEKIKPYHLIINAHQQKHNTEVLQSVIAICQLPSIQENGMAVMLFMSAAVDLVEGPLPVKESACERIQKS